MRTKLVATLGPSSTHIDRVRDIAATGVDVFRVNFAHGGPDELADRVATVRSVADEIQRPIAVLADLAGPKIRIGELGEPVELVEGHSVVVAPEDEAAGDELPTTYANLADDLERDNHILLDDGIMDLRVTAVDPPRVKCEVVLGGLLHANKGMNLPGVRVSAPALTKKDIADIDVALEADVDYIGLSFVQRAEDIADLRDRLPEGPLIVAKIEKDIALANIEPILAATDAVMVARGDLGVELPFEQVPVAQKRIIQLANFYGRPVITATQMLESMIDLPRPTRAEASDVANAMFDGTDAVMLSAETAIGNYPVAAAHAMSRIVEEVERSQPFEEGPTYDVPIARHLRTGATPTEHAIAAATVEAGRLLGAPAIITLTQSGFTARLVSSYRPPVPIIAVTNNHRTWRQLALAWGVLPVYCGDAESYDAMVDCARDYLLESGLAEVDERVAVTAGYPFDVSGTTNTLRVEEMSG